ncbi:MMPL family transporter [Haliea sp. E1-2-M8]|uniref:efflux RND transporter permease subunit n=1 Tax=Haliea sp. E1-2-M8 TaxID=3064706 RepID=UPI0027217C53|nr:MMPL family transporter [Haliea sp. E1-2-M8]MDO8861593.1 MMPL family transporter [Haliea sp. E1-2-M8]
MVSHPLLKIYDALVLRRPFVSLALVALLLIASVSQLPKLKLDASADSLMLQGDPALDFFREVSEEYSAEDFMLLTWQPQAPLFSDESLLPLRRMADELRELPGVSSVVTVWDVPLLESPPVSLSDITSGEPLPSLKDPGIDRELALQEFTTSPIYAELLVSREGDLTAVQVNLQRDERYFELLQKRDRLRQKDAEGTLSDAEAQSLEEVEAAFKAHTAQALEAQSALVQSVRGIADDYRSHARIFVGGVPMITADMVSFVRSDLMLFGSAILGVMLLVLGVIFRRVRWTVIPLATCVATSTVMLGLLAFLDWRMTVISSNFVAVLLIISLAIAIHLVVRYRELHAEHPEWSVHDRVLQTVALMAVPCVYTGITTIVAFMSLVVSGIQPVIDFGWMMTVGIVVALVLAFVLVPCLTEVWPQGRPFVYKKEHQPLTVYFGRATEHFGTTILVGTAVILGLTVLGISRLQVENRFIDYFKETTEIYQGMELLDSRLGGTIPLDIILSPPDSDAPLPGLENLDAATDAPAEDDPFLSEDDGFGADEGFASEDAASDDFADDGWDDDFSADFDSFSTGEDSFTPSYWFSLEGMRILDRAHRHVDQQEETGKVLSLSTTFAVIKDLLGDDIGSVELALVQKSLPQDVAELMVEPYFSEDQEQARISARVMETSEQLRRNAFLERLHDELVEVTGLEPEQIQFTGMLVLYNNVLQSLFRSQILTLGVVFVAILAMFLLLFRSLSLAFIALAPNIVAAGLVLGVMGLAGIPLDIMTITIAAIVVGIGVDDCIHYVHRFMREFPKDRNYLATMHRCHYSIGRAMYYTTITVVIGFSMLTVSNFKPSIYFGLLTVLAMIAAVVGALLLLPKLILVLRPLGPEGEPSAEGSR